MKRTIALFGVSVIAAFYVGQMTARYGEQPPRRPYNRMTVHELNEELRDAADRDDLAALTQIITMGSPFPDVDTSDGFPLTTAIANGDAKMVRVLLDHKASPHVMAELPLRMASEKGNIPIMKMLLEAGADPTTLQASMDNFDAAPRKLLQSYIDKYKPVAAETP